MSPRVVQLGLQNNQARTDRTTYISYGSLRAGKTRFAATFPRPIFLSEESESGWKTIESMPDEVFFEPGRRPEVWAISKVSEMIEGITEIKQRHDRDPNSVMTVVIDSLTFYSDLYFNTIERMAVESNKPFDPRQLYAKLQGHLRDLRIRTHQIGINVVWLCLESPPDEHSKIGRPMLVGQNATKFSAGCDYILYHHVAPTGFEIRTRKYGMYIAGGRDEGALPDPLGWTETDSNGNAIFVPQCSYIALAAALGLPTSMEEILAKRKGSRK